MSGQHAAADPELTSTEDDSSDQDEGSTTTVAQAGEADGQEAAAGPKPTKRGRRKSNRSK